MRASFRAAGMSLVVAVCIAVCPRPAEAQVYNHRDARHDVASVDALTPGSPRNEPANKSFDVTHLQVIHGSKTIRFNVKLREADMKGVYSRSLQFLMRTNRSSYWGSWDSYHGAFQYTLFEDNVGPVKCGAQRSWVTPKRRLIWWSFPRSCFHDPRWIRVSVAVTGQLRDRKRDFADLAQSNRPQLKHAAYTRRLRPGN